MRFIFVFGVLAVASKLTFGEEFRVLAGSNLTAAKLQNDGVAYLNRGDYANARRNFDAAIRIDPSMWPAYYNRAVVGCREHKLKQALADASMAERGRASFTQSAILHASINSKLGNQDAALRELKVVVAVGSRGNAYAHALAGLAWFYSTCPDSKYRNAQLALTEAKQACDLTKYQTPGFLDTLAAAYAETGDFVSAIRFEEKAISIGDSPVALRDYREHMNTFKQHHPWRETATN